MPTITVNGQPVACRERAMVLQACLDAGVEMPYYCYHPGLSIPASCRICLVEVEGLNKLVPSCQTPVRDGMVVYSNSTKAVANRKAVMEYLLTSHPLDCPVCDQAGECFLQDYSYQYGRSEARFEEAKERQAKKDVGDHILLYSDRCIYCTRCVRFTREVSGTSELYVKGRGATQEIDAFPGKPVNNKLAGNVVDICPVGALLDKDFLFKQRVWLLKSTPSVSAADSGGENIWIDQNENVVYRVRPRFNAEVNRWWISDDTRYSWKVMYDPRRLVRAARREHGAPAPSSIHAAVEAARTLLEALVRESGQGSLYVMLSPMMACEEAWLLGQWIRQVDPQAVLVLGPVPDAGEDEVFRHSVTGQETFRIQSQKVPNAAGVKRVMDLLGGVTATLADWTTGDKPELKRLKGGWIVGGYHSAWAAPKLVEAAGRGPLVVQDVLPSALSEAADVVLPGAVWTEKEGCWENYQGRIQPFAAAVTPPETVLREGELYYGLLLRRTGLYSASAVREEMGQAFAAVPPPDLGPQPAFEFEEL